jgi:hypothetical protein
VALVLTVLVVVIVAKVVRRAPLNLLGTEVRGAPDARIDQAAML